MSEKGRLTDADFVKAATELKCEVAAIKAVADVESIEGGFDKPGRIIIRFEAHRFQRYTSHRYDHTHPHLSHSYHPGQPGGRSLFNEAFQLNPAAALMSTSWGKFQMMGDECWRAGFGTQQALDPHSFVAYMQTGEAAHLDAFVKFVISKRLAQYIRAHNWADFAAGYNGSGYKANQYDTKMASRYNHHCRQPLNIPAGAPLSNLAPAAVPESAPEVAASFDAAPSSLPSADDDVAEVNEQGQTPPVQDSPRPHLPFDIGDAVELATDPIGWAQEHGQEHLDDIQDRIQDHVPLPKIEIPAIPPLPVHVPPWVKKILGGGALLNVIGGGLLAWFKDNPATIILILGILKWLVIGLAQVATVVIVAVFIQRIYNAKLANDLNLGRLRNHATEGERYVYFKGWKSSVQEESLKIT
jgi:hypothetical protein